MNDIHPTETGGTGRLWPRRTTYKTGDTIQEMLECAQCGFPFRVKKDLEGNSADSPGISYQTNPATGTNFAANGDFQGWSLGTSFSNRGNLFTTADSWDLVNGFSIDNLVQKDQTVLYNNLSTLKLEAYMTILQVVNFTVSASYTTSATSYASTGLTASITPKFNTSKILILASGSATLTSNSSATGRMTIYRNAINLGGSDGLSQVFLATGIIVVPFGISWYDSPATLAETVYTAYIQSDSALNAFSIGGSLSLILMEIAQ